MLHEHISYKLISRYFFFPYKYKKAARHSERRSGSRDVLVTVDLRLTFVEFIWRCLFDVPFQNIPGNISNVLLENLLVNSTILYVRREISEATSLSYFYI